MKVLFVGNLLNLSYWTAKALRRRGVGVDLFQNKHVDPIHLPSHIDKKVPKWVSYFKSKNKISQFFEILRKSKAYDVVQGFYSAGIPLQFSSKPYILHSQGSDFRVLAQQWYKIEGMLMRRAFRKARFFICSQPDQIPLIQKGGFDNVVYIPVFLDEKWYKIKPVRKRSKQFVLFHPTNHIWSVKGNDVFFKALAKFIKAGHKNVVCHVVKRGEDFERSVDLIKKLGIEKHLRYFDILPEEELVKFIQDSDVIVDQFKVGSFGGISLQGMLLGKPVLTYLDKRSERIFYHDSSPVPSCSSVDEIYHQLVFFSNKRNRVLHGSLNRKFVIKHHSTDRICKKFIKLYRIVHKEVKKS